MELTKHVRACVVLSKGDSRIVIDPGSFTPNAAELAAATDVVLITHEHPDHFDEELLAHAIENRPELTVYGPASVVERWDGRGGQLIPVAEGVRFDAAGFEVAVHGELHASIHADIPRVHNVGYLIDGTVYHPGDSYHVPPSPVGTLLLHTSGPWTKLGEALDYVRAVKPQQLLQIHEVMLSEVGQQFAARFLSPAMLLSVPLDIVAPGEAVDV